MVLLNKLRVISITNGEPVTYTVGSCGLLSIQFVNNGTYRLVYDNKTVVFVKAKESVAEGKEV